METEEETTTCVRLVLKTGKREEGSKSREMFDSKKDGDGGSLKLPGKEQENLERGQEGLSERHGKEGSGVGVVASNGGKKSKKKLQRARYSRRAFRSRKRGRKRGKR